MQLVQVVAAFVHVAQGDEQARHVVAPVTAGRYEPEGQLLL